MYLTYNELKILQKIISNEEKRYNSHKNWTEKEEEDYEDKLEHIKDKIDYYKILLNTY